MTKDFFMQLLAKGLYSLPVTEREEILTDYHEHFEQGAAAGQTEAEIVDHLGDPADIARDYVEAWQEQHADQGDQAVPEDEVYNDQEAQSENAQSKQKQEQSQQQQYQYKTSQNSPPYYDTPVSDAHYTQPPPRNPDWGVGAQTTTAVAMSFAALLVALPLAVGLFSLFVGFFFGGIGAVVAGITLITVIWIGPITVFIMLFLISLGGLFMVLGYVFLRLMIKGIVWFCRLFYSLVCYGELPGARRSYAR